MHERCGGVYYFMRRKKSSLGSLETYFIYDVKNNILSKPFIYLLITW